MAIVLISGFEPFGDDPINPAQDALEQLQDQQLPSGSIVKTCLIPTVRNRSIEVLAEKIDEYQPQLVIALGLAVGRAAISVERIAINMDDFRIADNDGNQVIDEPVVPGGPAAYFSTLPIKAMISAIRKAGIPAEISNTAGTYVCNHIFYGLRHKIEGSQIRGGFVHLPLLPKQAQDGSYPSMALQTLVAGLLIGAEAASSNQTDIKMGAGRIS